jgi:protein O-mannosyl-transferase
VTGLRRHAAFMLLLAVAIFAAYWPGRGGGFVLDDVRLIQRNSTLQAVDGLDPKAIASASLSGTEQSSLARPLSMFTFALNQATTGGDVPSMKVTNFALHTLNALLVLWLAARLLALPSFASVDAKRRAWAVRFIAAAWALHPLHATTILYVVQRMELLAHAFVFAGLLLYLAGRKRQIDSVRGGTPRVFAALVIATGVGILAKETAALLPLYILGLEACLLRFRTHAGVSRTMVASWSGLVIAGAVTTIAWLLPHTLPVYAARDFTLGERLLTEPRVLLEYLQWSVLPLPSSLGLFHDDIVVSRGWWSPPSTSFAVLGIVALVALAFVLLRRRPLTALGMLWWLAAHALTGTFVPLELTYEHRNYFAVLGVCLVLADLLLLAPSRDVTRRLGASVAGVIVVAFAGVTTIRASEWRTPETFAMHEAAKRPASPRAQLEYARILIRATGYRANSPLLPDAWAALERARAVPGSRALPHQVALILSARTGTLGAHTDWWDDLVHRLRTQRLEAENIATVVSLGDCAADGLCDFPPNRMLSLYGAALSHGPSPTILASYGKYALHALRDYDLALRAWTDAVALSPHDAQLRYNLARLHLLLGNTARARAERDTLAETAPIANHVLVSDLDARLRNPPTP